MDGLPQARRGAGDRVAAEAADEPGDAGDILVVEAVVDHRGPQDGGRDATGPRPVEHLILGGRQSRGDRPL